MPSNYAHKRLGNDVKYYLCENLQARIVKYSELFDIGLHGPDILFYHKPLSNNKVKTIGSIIHQKTGEDFFYHAIEMLRKTEYFEAGLVYLYGCLCHFVMDTICHAYIIPKTKKFHLSHIAMEVEFDRTLMVLDGLSPVKYKICDYIVASKFNAEVIKMFYPDITLQEVYSAIKGFHNYNNILVLPYRFQRIFVYWVMKLVGKYDKLKDMIINYEADPVYFLHSQELLKQYPFVLAKALQVILDFEQYIDGKLPFDEIFQHTFDADLKV